MSGAQDPGCAEPTGISGVRMVMSASAPGGRHPSAVAIDLLPAAVIRADAQAHATEANAVWTQLTGQGPEQWRERGWFDVLAPSQRRGECQKLLRAIAAGRSYRTDWTVEGNGTGQKILEVVAVPELVNGRAEGLVATLCDVTAQRALVEQLHHRATHDELTGLCNRAEFLVRVGEALRRPPRLGPGAAVLFVDIDGLKGVNDRHGHAAGDRVLKVVAAAITAGVRPEDLVARYGGDEFTVLCADVEGWDEAISIADRIRATVEERAASDGVTVSVGVVLAEDGPADASEVVHAADRAMYRAKQGSHAVAARPRVVGLAEPDDDAPARLDPMTVLAHELRTPLATITQAVHLLRQRGDRLATSDIDEVLAIVERQSARLTGFVEDLLEVGRAGAASEGRGELACFADAIADALDAAPPPPGHTVAVDDPAAELGLGVVGAPASLVRVVVNLLTNAYRYGGRNITITAGEPSQGMRTMVVSDDGRGIPDDLLPVVFAPFTRARTREGDNAGAGLGLAIARRIIESHGGQLVHEPVLPHGAAFAITLPAASSGAC